ncbi:MAG: hypothetical protein V2A62_05145 [Candidatus Woesearchaeota archaeon]
MDKINLPPNQKTEKQEDILKGLLEIGEEVACLYSDALEILRNDNLKARSNLLAYLAREIDSSLREILASKSMLDDTLVLPKEETDEIKKKVNSELASKGLEQVDNIQGIVVSICNSLGLDKDRNLLTEWIVVSAQLHKFTHRHGTTKQPRSFELFKDVWERYETILFRLVGNYYNFLDKVVDGLLKKESPSKEVLDILPSIIKIEAREHYFFTRLERIGWLKPLNDAGFFDPDKNPKLVKNPDGNGFLLLFWNVLSYLERITPKAQDAHLDLIIAIVKRIIEYQENGKRIGNSRTDYQIFKIICALPSERIAKEHIEFISEAFISDLHNSLISSDLGKILIPNLIRDKNIDRLLELIEVVTRFKVNEKGLDKIEPIVEEYWFADLVNKNMKELFTFCGVDLSNLLIDRINEIRKADAHSFNNAWIPTIEDHEQHTFSDRYEAVLIRFLRNSLLRLDIKEVKPIIENILTEDLDILMRIAYFVINQRYAELKDLLWKIEDNPLECFGCKHELYELFRNRAKEFDQKEIAQFIKWVETIRLPHLKEKEEEYLAHLRKEWYSSLLASEDKAVFETYKSYEKKSPQPIEHAGFISWFETWCGEVSPLQEIDLSKMTSKAISQYLKDFKEERGMRTPSAIGLAEILTRVVKDNSEKFSEEIEEYVGVPMIYRYSLLDGFAKAWVDKKQINWEKVLEFVLKTLQSDKKENYGAGFHYYDWFMAQACQLIEEGTKNDEHSYDAKLLPLSKEILIIMSKEIKAEICKEDDYITFTLNSIKGKLLEAMLDYSLRKARVENKREWDTNIQEFYKNELERNPSIELHTMIGQYIKNFLYLDENWIKDNIPQIFPKDKKEFLLAALSGYFFNHTVYSNLYQMFKEGEIYSSALQYWKDNPKHLREKLVAHICLAYVEGWELLKEGSLIMMLVEQKEFHKEIIRFFSINSKNLKPEYIPKIKLLWRLLFDSNKETNKQILGELTNWLTLLPFDADVFEWVKEGAQHIKPYWETYHFVESLAKLVDSYSKEVGILFWSLIEKANVVPDYKKEDIFKVVETLYQKGEKDIADKICNHYGANGNNMLRKMYIAH